MTLIAESMRPLDNAIHRACLAIRHSQREDGAWDGLCELGPSCTAQVLIALSYMGKLAASDATDGAKWLRGQQRPDGGFVAHPFASQSDVSATACAWAALRLSPAAEDRTAADRAWTAVLQQGGLDAVVALAATGDTAAIYLALGGHLDAHRLTQPPLAWVLVPKLVSLAMTRVNYSIVLGAIALSLISRRLRGEWGKDGADKNVLARLSVARAVALISTFQNVNGGFNSVTIETAIFGAALYATGRPDDLSRANRAAAWLLTRAIRTSEGLHFDIFPSDIWTTAYELRVLLEAGTPRSDVIVQRAVDYLVRTQSQVLQPIYNNARPRAIRSGGWAFEDGNPTMPDPDDTGVVLTALGLALAPGGEGALPDALAARARSAVTAGRRWMQGMQNPDGGWAGFAWGLPGKKPGPAMTAPFAMTALAMLGAVFDPPVILGDPSTEDLTARAIEGVLASGDDPSSATIRQAVAFLRVQQCDNGAWWGRWVVNYLAGSAYVLSALARAQEDLTNADVQRAIAWVLAHQNEDGGFGEGVDSYMHPTRAGRGASTAPLTGLVLTALVDVGLGEGAAAARALAYLLRTQRPDGTWPNGHYLATALPPLAFYTYAPAASYLPLQALARYAHRHAPRALLPNASRWTDAVLEPMRQVQDPVADTLVGAVYRANESGAVNPLLMMLFHNDDAIPPGLPSSVHDYFETTAALPEWADAQQIAIAQQLFANYGAQITMGLFCASLPQAYAAANGASVLVQTGALQRNTRQRIFETAQFVFDVLDEGAFASNGRGIRAAQRVRLMHAAIRALIERRTDKPWNSAVRGKPINQEDLAGTLMTFSAVTFDALRRYGTPVTDAQGEAWIHTWTVVGHFLGIDRSLMPTSLADAELLMDAIRRRQWAPSQEGRDLTASLLAMMDRFFTFDVPGLSGFAPTQMRFLAGDHCCDLVAVPTTRLEGLLALASNVAHRIESLDHEAIATELLGRLSLDAMKVIVMAEREGKQASFRLPESLRRSVIPST